jgi:hypothetical protein
LIVGLEALKKKYFAFIEKSLKEIDRNINNLKIIFPMRYLIV